MTRQDRMARLKALRVRLDAEIAALERETPPRRRVNRSRHEPVPECGTERKYQWHRYHEPESWPLPAGDPCGCAAAHSAHVWAQQQARDAEQRAARRRERVPA